jgi:hypothetical protein
VNDAGSVLKLGQLVLAVERVVSAVRQSRLAGSERSGRVATAIQEIATITRARGQASVEHALATVAASMITPVDPSSLTWNAFRLFEIEDSETSWTKWMASLLSPENGTALSQLAWRSVCDAVLEQGQKPPVHAEPEDNVLATAQDWRSAREIPLPYGSVDREVADEDLGRPDIVVDAPDLFVVLENKLDAGWHDGAETQAAKYHQFGMKHRGTRQRLGLVLLTKRDDFEMGADGVNWVRILYRDLARALRRSLRQALGVDASHSSLLALWPALLTVAAIEQDLCERNGRRVTSQGERRRRARKEQDDGFDKSFLRQAARSAPLRPRTPLRRLRGVQRARRRESARRRGRLRDAE